MQNKKSQGLPLNVIVIAAILLVVLILVIIFFSSRLNDSSKDLQSCYIRGGNCVENKNECTGTEIPAKCTEEAKLICCIPNILEE